MRTIFRFVQTILPPSDEGGGEFVSKETNLTEGGKTIYHRAFLSLQTLIYLTKLDRKFNKKLIYDRMKKAPNWELFVYKLLQFMINY